MLSCIQHMLRPTILLSARRCISTAGWSKLESGAAVVMSDLVKRGQTVAVAETTSGGLISAALWSSPLGPQAFKGSGIRLAYGINRSADKEGVARAREHIATKMAPEFADVQSPRLRAVGMGLVYEDGVEHSESGSAAHALELAHAAKLNLGTDWGIGESSVPGPDPHRRTGLLPGMGFVAVAGPSPETTGVLKVGPSDDKRSVNMLRFAQAGVDLMHWLMEGESKGKV